MFALSPAFANPLEVKKSVFACFQAQQYAVPPLSQMKLTQCIDVLGSLPHKYLLPIILESPSELEFWGRMRFTYQSIAAWLRVLLLMEKAPLELIESGMKYFLPHAEMSKALADLVTAVHVRAGDSRLVQAFDTPAELWLACELDKCQTQLQNSGLVGQPALVGKTDLIHNLIQRCESIEAQAEHCLVSDQPSKPTRLVEQLEVLALVLAKEDPDFNYRHLRPYLKAIKHGMSQIRRCKEIQFGYYLPKNDQLFITGKDKKLPPGM